MPRDVGGVLEGLGEGEGELKKKNHQIFGLERLHKVRLGEADACLQQKGRWRGLARFRHIISAMNADLFSSLIALSFPQILNKGHNMGIWPKYSDTASQSSGANMRSCRRGGGSEKKSTKMDS